MLESFHHDFWAHLASGGCTLDNPCVALASGGDLWVTEDLDGGILVEHPCFRDLWDWLSTEAVNSGHDFTSSLGLLCLWCSVNTLATNLGSTVSLHCLELCLINWHIVSLCGLRSWIGVGGGDGVVVLDVKGEGVGKRAEGDLRGLWID